MRKNANKLNNINIHQGCLQKKANKSESKTTQAQIHILRRNAHKKNKRNIIHQEALQKNAKT